MIDESYVDQGQRVFDASGNELVGLAWLLDAGRMIMVHDASGRAFLQSQLHNFAWMHAGPLRLAFSGCL